MEDTACVDDVKAFRPFAEGQDIGLEIPDRDAQLPTLPGGVGET